MSFVGNDVGTTQFRDKLSDRDIEGNLLTQYNTTISFITRNLRTVQIEKEFNTLGQLEIPLEVFVETITNALIHRDYYINSPIRLFIFDNRIEIHSPGILPDSVTEETIKQGISVPRNKLLFDNAKYLLPYTGIGSGIMRAMKSYDKIIFQNNIATEEFLITILRDEIIEENVPLNVPLNDKLLEDVPVNNFQITILGLIRNNPTITASKMAQVTGVTEKTVKRALKFLQEKGIIKREGARKIGTWQIIEKQNS